MERIALHVAQPTGDAEVDRAVRGFLELLTLLFPRRVRACYLTGSWADGMAVRVPGESLNASDVDLTVIFTGTADAGDRDRFERCRRACEEINLMQAFAAETLPLMEVRDA